MAANEAPRCKAEIPSPFGASPQKRRSCGKYLRSSINRSVGDGNSSARSVVVGAVALDADGTFAEALAGENDEAPVAPELFIIGAGIVAPGMSSR